ncbi:hypothetical protein CerSpe_214530 [Prunus speciosa]
MNLRFGMMTPTVLDMAALFGLSPLGVEVNAALVAHKVEGSFKASWPTVAKLAGAKAKNMLNYSSFYSNFGVEFAHLADYLAQGGRLALGPFLLGHIYRTLHDVVTDGMKPKHGGPLWRRSPRKPNAEAAAAESLLAALIVSPLVVATVPSLAAMVPVEPPLVAPHRPSGIVFRSPPRPSLPLSTIVVTMPPAPLSQESTVVTKVVVTEARVASVPSPPPVASAVVTELMVGEEPTSSDDLAELYASLHEEGGSSAPAGPLDEDSWMRIPGMNMTEGCSLEQELAEIKQQAQPAMAQLKENDLVVKRENEELAQVEAQIAELKARRDLILERRNHAAAAGAELKSSARQLLKAAVEKKKALAERKLIRARWLKDMDSGDIAWRWITCLIWGMFS